MTQPSSTPLIDHSRVAPNRFRALYALSTQIHNASLGKDLLEMVFLRVSQIHGCAFCVDMHARALAAQGESAQRIHSLVTWHEVGFYTDAERAALHWAEQLTRIAGGAGPDDSAFDALRAHFDERAIVELGYAVATINAWNRLGVGFRMPVAAVAA